MKPIGIRPLGLGSCKHTHCGDLVVATSKNKKHHTGLSWGCVLAALLLLQSGGAYAGIVNGEYVFESLDLSEGDTNSFGQPVVGGEAASTRLLREEQERQNAQSWYQTLGIATGDTAWGPNKDDNVETLTDGIYHQFTSGGSYLYEVLSGIGRAGDHLYDEQFNASMWIDRNREALGIEDQHMSTIMGAGSEGEASGMVKNINDRKVAQKRIQRAGIAAQFFVRAIAALPDIAIALFGLALLSVPVRSAFRRTATHERETART